jgi:hypothetical protein
LYRDVSDTRLPLPGTIHNYKLTESAEDQVDEFNEYVSVILIDSIHMNLRTIKSAINHVAVIITLHLFDVRGVIGFIFTE